MNLSTVLVSIFLIIWLTLSIRYIYLNRNNGCNMDCSSCNRKCSSKRNRFK